MRVLPHRGLLQTVEQVMMLQVKVRVGLAHQRLPCFFGRLQETSTDHMTHHLKHILMKICPDTPGQSQQSLNVQLRPL